MTAEELVERVCRSGGDSDRYRGLIDLDVAAGQIVLRTGERAALRARTKAQFAGIVAAIAGCGLLLLSPWFAFLIVAGVLYTLVAPKRIRPLQLIAIDAESQCVLGSNIVPMARVQAIRGAFETKGWDGFSVVSAMLDDGSSAPLLMLLGADERLAEAVCSELGALLDCPAEYTGTSGAPVACHPRPAH